MIKTLFKKKITEQEAALQFVHHIIKEAKEAWPTIHDKLKNSFKEKFVVEEEKMAAFDLALAAIAQDLQAVKNLFSKDQAERIERWVLKCIDTEDWGEYSIDEVKNYGEKFQRAIQDISTGGDPLSAIPARLLHRWLGKNIQNFEVEMSGKKTGVINPLLLMMVSGTLTCFLGTWKNLKNNFKIVEGDMPFEETPSGLKDYNPKTHEKELMELYNELPEKHLAPKQFQESQKKLEKSDTKRIYKVLIKGPWEGIKEADSTIFIDDISDSVDKDGNLYAICHYDNGEPKYTTLQKKMWERLDEVLGIIMNPNLLEETKLAEINRLLNK